MGHEKETYPIKIIRDTLSYRYRLYKPGKFLFTGSLHMTQWSLERKLVERST